MGTTKAHRNRAVTDVFEPGSTMKPITVAAALNARLVTPDTRIDLNPGYMKLGRYTIRDHNNYGVQTITGVITKSSNAGASLIVHRIPDQTFYDFVRRFGYGQSTHSGFPGEASGLFPAPSRWSGTTKQTMSYGYGLNVTPLQIAHAYATLGNDGRAMTPTFVKGQHNDSTQVVTPALAREIVRMMQTVTETGGTATQGPILGYHVAGKTGTARRASGGSYERKYVSYFAGLVPVDKPRFAMVVAVNDPTIGSYFGGLVAAPVFKHVMEGALRLMDVPPDDIDTWLAAQAAAEAKRSGRHVVATAPTTDDDTDDALPDDAPVTVAGAAR
jgi:cell division protein FtsI (penicillin-binding protein 3)